MEGSTVNTVLWAHFEEDARAFNTAMATSSVSVELLLK